MATDDKNVDTELEEETLTEPSPEEKTQTEESEDLDSKVVEKPDDEVKAVWESMKGKTQERIVELIRKNKQLQTSLSQRTYQPPTPAKEESAELSEGEIRDAVGKLRKYGVATQDDLRAIEDRLLLDAEHNRLRGKYKGVEGDPKYVSDEVEEYARSHYFGGNLEAAFKDMYFDEFVDIETKKRGRKDQTYTEKPIASVKVGEKPLTIESLRERLKQTDGAEWWSKNREKIEPLLEKLSQQ